MANLKRIARIGLSLVLAASLLTGCWDRVETNDVAFVLTSSVDLEDDGKYRVSYLLPLPGAMGGASGGGGGTSGGKSYYVDSEVGTTMLEANSKLQKRMSRKLFLAHRRTIIIGEEFAKKGIDEMFDVAPRVPENRLTAFLVVTKGKGYDLLNAEPKFERFPAEAIRELAKSRQAMPTSTKDIGVALSFGSDPVVSYFEVRESQAAKKPSQEIQLVGYGQFKDDRMVGIFRNHEADGLMWLRNKIKEHTLSFAVDSDKIMSVLVSGGKSSIKPEIKGDKVTFKVTLNAVGSVREDLSHHNLGKAEILHTVERKMAEQIKKSVQAAIKQMQKEGTDSAQLGLIVWRHYPNTWKSELQAKWRDVFKEADFRITVEASISDTGLINQNVIEKEK